MPLLELSWVKGIRNVKTNGIFSQRHTKMLFEKIDQKHSENFKVIIHVVLTVLLHLQNVNP